MLLNKNFITTYKIPLLLVLASMLFYWSFAYNLVRTDYIKLVTLYSALFYLFYKIVNIFKHNTKPLTVFAFSFRALFILAIPNLSQDFYRFIWDGRMLFQGYNPYLNTVEYFIQNNQFPVAQAQELREGMGGLNASHFTNYPPINQLCFVIAAFFANKSILGSVVVLRILIIIADFGTLHFGKKLLAKLNLPEYNIFWFILNPFIIIELTGNLHFEGVMICFLVWSLYLLYSKKWILAAIIFACSIATKLIPLLFLPLFFQWFVNNKSSNKLLISKLLKLTAFYSIALATTVLLFVPFYSSEFINNYSKTVALWFSNFEFNASLYYIAREIGYAFRGYNEIAIIGKVSSLLVVIFVLIITFFRKNKTFLQLITAMLIALSFYYFTATTVHPWYLAMLLILSVFTKYKFPLVWSFVIILSYLAYLNLNSMDKSENLWVIALEYIIVFSVFLFEIFKKKPIEHQLL
ncbi:mannosyltransferase [Neotamlana laminarinivorans]|uniref:Mannosyltransferase n=1 Tax=Neotamlana laminarinivorans TaxID=2883124 RepID=A0A9X1I0F2_9FLAO|nr:mannosyltransferase [Tamlana laminarinivorans]MCB4799141.1 mannosyltransferase [Tamlana laminarinivorans]